MNRYIFHWKFGEDNIIFANSIQEATKNLSLGGGALAALDYWEEQKEIPYSEKLVVMDDKEVCNPIFIQQIKDHKSLQVGETITIKAYNREYPMKVKAFTGCTIEFV